MILTPECRDAETRSYELIKNFAPSYLRAFTLKKSFQIAFILLLSISLSGCFSAKRVPNLDAIFAQTKVRTGKRPVIIIPGIMGSELVNSETKERVWINLSGAKTDGLSLPISPNLAQNRDKLFANKIIERAKISSFLPEVSIYDALIKAMKQYGGYTPGDWENPDAANGGTDKYYIFAYDWRLDNIENARLLVRKVGELKRKIGNENLRFNIIAHSMGGLIARYAAMYGDADLPPDGAKPSPDWAGAKDFNKIFMFGTPNEGAMQAFKFLLRGYSIGGFNIAVLNREAAFSSPAVFQLLPHQNSARFYDENLNSMDIDFYNPETWKKYGWSAYSDNAFRSKFAGQPNAVGKNGKKSEYADETLEELDAYFVNTLKRAKLFQDALDAGSNAPIPIGLFAFGSDCDNTQDGVILFQNAATKNWQTMFTPKNYKTSGGKSISADDAKAKLYAPGDSIVTRRSLLAEQNSADASRRNLPVSAVFSCELHNYLTNSKIFQDNVLTALMQELN